ncbi:MAG: GGDEF domain-containing phosphodiesterase, partial [Gemmatimonadales bacterium]
MTKPSARGPWSDDATIDEISRLGRTRASLVEALSPALRLACALPDWHRASVSLFHTSERLPAVHPALTVELIDPDSPSAAHRTAYADGLRTVARLVVHAEDRPEAELEVFGASRVDSRGLRLLLASLEQIAGRERSRNAVHRAVELVRAQAREKPPAGPDRSAGEAPPEREAASQREAAPAALHDPETGLPVGPLLEDRLRMAIRRRRRGDHGLLAVLHVAPDPRTGEDRVSRAAIARRLVTAVRDTDTVGHLPGGDYLVIGEGLRNLEEAEKLAARLLRAGRVPANRDVGAAPDCRVGLVIGGPGHDDPADLMRDARTAMKGASRAESVKVFDPVVQAEEDNRELIEAELGRALASRELFLEYQPIVALDDGRIAGLEAYIRWRHPRVGLIPPAEFIDVAEISPLIHELGHWVLDEACQQIHRWGAHVRLSRMPPVDLNFTRTQLSEPGFADRFISTLRRHDLPGECFRIDVNESDLMDDPEPVSAVLARLRGHGVQAVVDDFGTGFSSLQVLHALPVSALKIDGSFIPGPESGIDAWVIARTIVELGKVLDLEVVAEGVETREQLRTLRQVGCRHGEGYVFSGPVSPAKTLELIRDGYPLELEPAADR